MSTIPFRKSLCVWFLFIVPCFVVVADEKADVDSIIAAGREGNRVMEHLDYLCNRFGPRLTGSDNLQNASEWARDTFASFGLENAHLEQWGTYAVGFDRGPWFGHMIEPTEKTLHFGTNAWSAGTKGVTRGRAVLIPLNEAEFVRARDQLDGAWVLTRRPEPNARPSAEVQKMFDAALKEAKIAGTIRPSAGELIHTFGSPPASWDKLPTTPNVNLLKKEYDEIAELLGRGEEVLLEFDIRNYFKKGPVRLYNVIADIPGKELPDEYVIVGGHIDSWDGATGAMDNGTGSAAAIEAARILMQAGVKPRRTIRFMLWSGEEQGLLGSMGYIKAHMDEMKKISAVLVDDGGTNYISGIMATETMISDFEQVFAPVKELDPEKPFKISNVKGLPAMIGSDQDSFLRAGVPGFYWMQSQAGYNRIHHTQFDTYDGAKPDDQKHSSIVIALGAYGIANLDHLVSRENLVASFFPMANRRLMGVQLDELQVIDVLQDTAAEKAGIKQGDVIEKVDGKKLTTRDELTAEIQKGEPKKTITVLREGKEMDFVLEWPKPPSKN
jgi:carboxypeptidase Q